MGGVETEVVMLARVARFKQAPGATDNPNVVMLRDIVRSQPGFRAGYHVKDAASGEALSIVIADGPEAFEAMGKALAARAPKDRVNAEPEHVGFYEGVEF
jgi:hypothetical protein